MNREDNNNKEDSNSISPLVKFAKNNRFPYKMIVHFLLVIFTTIQIVILFSYSNQYSRAQERLLYKIFLSSNTDQRQPNFLKEAYLYTSEEVKAHLISSINNYYNIDLISLEMISLPHKDISHIILDASYLNVKSNRFPKQNIPKQPWYKITQEDYGPFSMSDSDIKSYLNDIIAFRLNYTLKIYIPNDYTNEYECNLWNILQIYSFESRGHFVVRLNIVKTLCDYKDNNEHAIIYYFWSQFIWVHLAVLILSICSLISTWKYIERVANLFIRIKTKYKIIIQHEPQSNNSIYYNPLNDNDQSEYEDNNERIQQHQHPYNKKKMQFNKWSLICLMGNVIQFFGSLLAIFDLNHILSGTEILIGFGCFFAFIYIGRYIEYAKDYSTIYLTIQKSLPNVIRYLIGVTPVFLGFLFFGLCVFWRSERFSSVSDVMITLFSLANGDSIYDIFQELKGIHFFIGQVYLYLFCILFIIVVLNIFIAIIQEAYTETQNETKTHWMYNNKNDKEEDTSVMLPKIMLRHDDKDYNDGKGIHQQPQQNFSSYVNRSTKSVMVGKKYMSNTPTIHTKRFNSGNGSYDEHYMSKVIPLNESAFAKSGRRESFLENNSKDNEIRNKIRREFANIHEKIRQISDISKGIFKTKNQNVYEEVREDILDYINDNITTKIDEIKELFNTNEEIH